MGCGVDMAHACMVVFKALALAVQQRTPPSTPAHLAAPACIISTAQQARPNVIGQMLPALAQFTSVSTFDTTKSSLPIVMTALETLRKRCSYELLRAASTTKK